MTTNATSQGSTASIIALLMCAVAAQPIAAPGAGAKPVAAGPGAEPAREIRYAPQLRANPANAERYVVNGVCERQGVRQISRVLRRASAEEMWAFLPRARGTHACQWHEIGRDEKSEAHRADLHVDMGYLEKLMAENAELHIYHFHPLQYFECASSPECQQAAAHGKTGSLDPRWITDLVFSMPSPSDVHFMMEVTSRFHGHHRTLAAIRHKVVTPYGIVDYGLTKEGLARFEAERFGRSEGLYIAWLTASRLADDRVENVIVEQPGGIVAAVERLAQTLNNKFMSVSHSPFTP